MISPNAFLPNWLGDLLESTLNSYSQAARPVTHNWPTLWTATHRVKSLYLRIMFLGASCWPPEIVIRYATFKPMPVNRSAGRGPVVPVLVYDDVEKAIEWLCETFGFVERFRYRPRWQSSRCACRGGWLCLSDIRVLVNRPSGQIAQPFCTLVG